MRTARWIWRTRRSSEWPSETASGGSSPWTATISLSIAFTDESALQLSRRSIEKRLAAATARRWHQRSTSPAAQPRGARERALGLDGQLAQQVLSKLSCVMPSYLTGRQLCKPRDQEQAEATQQQTQNGLFSTEPFHLRSAFRPLALYIRHLRRRICWIKRAGQNLGFFSPELIE